MHPYLGISPHERNDMLLSMGVCSIDDLFLKTPKSEFQLPQGISELELMEEARRRSHQHRLPAYHFLGAGAYDHWVPSVIDYLVSRGEFLTSYTPYQPEVSQGTLQLIYEFQCLMTRLYGMEVANASVYDGAHALVECVGMALRIQKDGVIMISSGVHPAYRQVLHSHLGAQVQCIDVPVRKEYGDTDWDSVCVPSGLRIAAVVGQFPNVYGVCDGIDKVVACARQHHALSIVVNNEPYAFGLCDPAGHFGVDLVAAEVQALGNPVAFGGPHIGVVLCRKEYIRQLPGRLVARTRTVDGTKDAYTLTLATREQHIRRERATSNICTNQGLLVGRVVAHCALLGESGFRSVAKQCYLAAHAAYDAWGAVLTPCYPKGIFFNEFALNMPSYGKSAVQDLERENILLGVSGQQLGLASKDALVCCLTEKHRPEMIAHVTERLTQPRHPEGEARRIPS